MQLKLSDQILGGTAVKVYYSALHRSIGPENNLEKNKGGTGNR